MLTNQAMTCQPVTDLFNKFSSREQTPALVLSAEPRPVSSSQIPASGGGRRVATRRAHTISPIELLVTPENHGDNAS